MRAGGLASIALVLCVALGEPAGAGFGRADATPILAPTALSRSLAGSLALTSLPLARAATHLRVDPDAGIIRSLSLDHVPEDTVKFSLPVQHPGARKPTVPNDESLSHNKASAKERWARRHAWTHLGVLLDAGAENTTHKMRDLPSYGLDLLRDPSEAEADWSTRGAPKKNRILRPEPALAVLFDRYGGVEKAFDVLLRSTRENPSDPVMWSDLGNAYRVKGESDLAVECFERALRAQPHPDFYLNLGGVRFVMGEPEEAIRLFTLGLQMNPRHTLLQYSIGNAYASQGRTEEAVRSFEATLRIQPDFGAARQHLDKLKKEMRGRWLPSGGVAGACAALLVLCVFVQRAVSAFVLGTAAVAEGRVRNVERHGRVVGGVMNALGMRPPQTPAAHAAAAAAAAARGLEERNGGKHNRHGSGRHHKRH
jgi:tetratricopeptide (TPR) repeat protein